MQKLGEIASVKGGKRLPKGESLTTDPNSHPYIRTKDIENHVIKIDQLEYVPDAVQKKIARYIVDAGDLVVSIVGTVGSCAIVPAELHRANLTENCAKILLNTEDYTTDFLYYFLRSPQGQQEIFKNTVGSTQLKLPLYGIENIDLPTLTVTNQKAIAHILGTLDNKIELNQKMNQTLEEIAKAIFKSWFVDFDPVRAKAEDRPTGLPPEISDLFPDELVDSEIGEIPNGWDIRGLDHYLLLQRGFDLPTKDRIEGDFPVVAASGISSTHNLPKAKAPGVVTGRSGVLGKVFFVQQDFFPLNTTLWVKEFYAATPVFAYFLLGTIDFAVFNAGSAVPTLNRNHLSSLRFSSPPQALIAKFTKIATPLMESLDLRTKESATLEQIRDTLLPKLISGELRIPDAEKFLEEAGI